jgi:hypothetical protein
VKVSPQKCEFSGGDTIILASDGFYNCSPEFNRDILDIAHSFNLEKSVKKTIQKYMDFQDDDSTILILRNMNLNLELPVNIMDVQYPVIKGKMAKFQLVGILYEKLKQCIVVKDTEAALTILKIMDEDEILPSREMLDGLIDLMKKENHLNGHIMSGIVNLIKKNMKRN